VIVAGYPTGSVLELCASSGCELVPIAGPRSTRCRAVAVLRQGHHPRLHLPRVGETQTPASARSGWSARKSTSWSTARKALWHENARKLLDDGHAAVDHARDGADGIAVPLHPGAARCYLESA
jgi:TRAP-type uncharacterized transport system substrate-binding protein